MKLDVHSSHPSSSGSGVYMIRPLQVMNAQQEMKDAHGSTITMSSFLSMH